MLTIWGRQRASDCNGTTRKGFHRLGTLGLTGLSLGGLLRSRADAATRDPATKDTSVIWVWLGGRATHLETFDPKMDAPTEFRSTFGEVKPSIPGVTLGGFFPKHAARAGDTAFVPSFASGNSGRDGFSDFEEPIGGKGYSRGGGRFVALQHGTTRRRADAILKSGPDPNFVEPDGHEKADGFSTVRAQGPFDVGTASMYALGKAKLFPTDGGPAVVEVDVPQWIIESAIDVGSEVRFESGCGLKELLQAWTSLSKRLIVLTPAPSVPGS